MTFKERLATGPVILMDGAMGTELERRGVPMHETAWSATAIDKHPEVIRAVHEDYIRAGAELHIVHSFPTARHVLEPIGLGGKVEVFNRRAVELCHEAIERAGRGGRHRIARSITSNPPRANPSSLPSIATLRANFDEQAGILQDAGVDLFVLEMLCDVEISIAAVEAAAATGLPFSAGFTCLMGEDGRTVETGAHRMGFDRHMTLDGVLSEVLPAIPAEGGNLVAIMHCDFNVTDAALPVLAEHWSGPVAVYPNSGTFKVPNWQFDTVCEPEVFADAGQRWAAQGARIVGGCCGLGPDHVRALRNRLPS